LRSVALVRASCPIQAIGGIRLVSRAQIKRLRSLHRRKGRIAEGLFLAEGPHLAAELLSSPLTPVFLVYTAEAANREPGAALIRSWIDRGLSYEEAEPHEIEAIADTATPQGIVAVGETRAWDWQDLEGARILVLDGLQDPGNVGTLFRLAEALHIDGVVCLDGTADVWSPKVVRSSAGSVFRVPFVCAAWPEARDHLRSVGRVLWAADAGGAPFEHGDSAPARWALVLGNEGAGVSPEVLADADTVISIRLAGGVESLNVAMAGALLIDRITGGRQ